MTQFIVGLLGRRATADGGRGSGAHVDEMEPAVAIGGVAVVVVIGVVRGVGDDLPG